MIVNISLQVVICMAEPYSLKYPYGFAALFILGAILTAPNFMCTMILTNRLFPHDKWVFIYVSYAMDLSLISMYIAENYILPEIGYQSMFFGIAIMLLIPLALVTTGLLQDQNELEKVDYEIQIEN